MKIFSTMICSAVAPLALSAALTWYPADDWKDKADPSAVHDAPKGGTLRLFGGQGPKSYNGYVDNNAYTHMTFSLLYSSLLSIDSQTLDFEPSLARRWALSDDGTEFVFELDERARWSDGRPVSAHDVKWTFDAVMNPKNDTGSWKTILGAFESPEIKGERKIIFRKKNSGNKDWRDLMNIAFFKIMPSHFFKDIDFNKADLLDSPVSGPYRLSKIREGLWAEFSRFPGWWRSKMPSSAGVYNFDRIVVKYYCDNENAFEAFKKREIDVYPVYSARIMSDCAKVSSFAKNHALRRRVKNREPIGFQGFAMNMRRSPFNDIKVRMAMAKLLDREMMNRTMMNSEYFLMNSYFTDLYDAKNPCLNTMWEFDPEGAAKLLDEALWLRSEDGRRMKNGEAFVFTFLSRSVTEDKFLALFNHQLKLQGIEMKIERKDFASWMRDMDEYNFDMTWAAWGASVFRMPETTWHSKSAAEKGGNNIVGFSSPEVDKIIEEEKLMMTSAERENAYRKIDALIAKEVPYVLLWHTAEHRLVSWNKFGAPASVLGRYGYEESVLSYWWYDIDRAVELKKAIADGSCLPNVPFKVDYDKVSGND
jgi:microcin C transport system substrate-binding protein